MARAVVLVVTLVGVLVIPLVLKKCVAPKTPVAAVAPSGAPLPAAVPAPAVAAGNHPIGYGLTFGLAPLEDADPKDVANMVCDAGDTALARPYKGSCNPNVGDTSCRIVLPVLCIKPGALPRPGGLSGGGWTRGELGATQAVMGAVLDSEIKANVMCERDLGLGWRMATFADGGNYLDDEHYDHQDRGDTWALQGRLGPGISGYGRYWVHSQGQTANCWNE